MLKDVSIGTTMEVLQQSSGHTLRQIRKGLWQLEFTFPTSTNCWIWQEADGLTLIDAGMPRNASTILGAVRQIGQPLRRIIITHAHPDHAGAAAEIASTSKAIVYAHAGDIPFLQGQCMSEMPGFWLCKGVLKAGSQLGLLKPPTIASVKSIEDGDMIGSLKIIHSPGHTPGSVSIWSEQEKALFCGDNICSSMNMLHVGLPWFTLDLNMQKKSLAHYKELPAELLLSGHGPVYKGEFRKDLNRILR